MYLQAKGLYDETSSYILISNENKKVYSIHTFMQVIQ